MLCNKCKKEKPKSDFPFNKKRGIPRHPCKECCNARRRLMYKLYGKRSANPEHSDLLKNRGIKPKRHEWCCGCKQYLPSEIFNGIKYKSTYCKQCQRRVETERMKMIKENVIRFLGGKCTRCNGIFHYAAYDLHHRDASTKEKANTWSHLRRCSWNKIANVLNQGELVLMCKNCHSVEHCTLQ